MREKLVLHAHVLLSWIDVPVDEDTVDTLAQCVWPEMQVAHVSLQYVPVPNVSGGPGQSHSPVIELFTSGVRHTN